MLHNKRGQMNLGRLVGGTVGLLFGLTLFPIIEEAVNGTSSNTTFQSLLDLIPYGVIIGLIAAGFAIGGVKFSS